MFETFVNPNLQNKQESVHETFDWGSIWKKAAADRPEMTLLLNGFLYADAGGDDAQ